MAAPEKIEKNTVTTSNYLGVYLDTSASMSGYVAEKNKHFFAVAADNETVYSKTLLELRTLLSSLSPQPQIFLRTVDDKIGIPSVDDLAISRAAFSRKIYTGQETNLAGAFLAFNQPVEGLPETKIPKVHILVTDGVQSSLNQSENTSCQNGSDWRCVKKQINELLIAGWGGGIIAVKSEFQGTVYSEIKKGKINFDSEKKIDKYRPFYLYVLSPIQADAEKIMEGIKSRLSEIARQTNLSDIQLYREFPLSGNFAGNKMPTVVDIPQSESQFVEVSQEDDEATRLTVKVSTKTETQGHKTFNVKVKIPWTRDALDMGTLEELFKLLTWKIEKVPIAENERHRYPELELSGQTLDQDGSITLNFSTGWRNEILTHDWRMYRVTGAIDKTKIPNWVREWSTKDDTLLTNGNKTLNLESSFSNLWETTNLKDFMVAEVCLRVGPK